MAHGSRQTSGAGRGGAAAKHHNHADKNTNVGAEWAVGRRPPAQPGPHRGSGEAIATSQLEARNRPAEKDLLAVRVPLAAMHHKMASSAEAPAPLCDRLRM